ncbi:hypothetical protein D3C76_984010 [compost metagenome]
MFVPFFVEVFERFFIFRLSGGENDLAIANDSMLQVIRKSKCTKDAGNIHTPLHVHKAERNFILFAVPIGVLCFKSNQSLRIFIQGLRHFQPQLIQPAFIDHMKERVGSQIIIFPGWKSVDMTIRCGDRRFDVRPTFKKRFQVRCVLIN